jgi:hypothetical protein
MFSVFFLWFMGEVGFWFMALDTPSAEQSAFATGVVAAGAAWFKFYVESGPNRRPVQMERWDGE